MDEIGLYDGLLGDDWYYINYYVLDVYGILLLIFNRNKCFYYGFNGFIIILLELCIY